MQEITPKPIGVTVKYHLLMQGQLRLGSAGGHSAGLALAPVCPQLAH